jgi:hypothetical protein
MKTLFSDLPKPLKSWPELFDLHQNTDGSFRVELSGELSRRELRLRWKLSANDGELILALGMLALLPADVSDEFLALIANKFSESLGDDLKTLCANGESMRAKSRARKNVEKAIKYALDALEKKGIRKAHGSATVFEIQGREMPLAWVVIEQTRMLIETTQRLPTKREVRGSIMAVYERAADVSSAQWAAAFKEAGLASLERAATW